MLYSAGLDQQAAAMGPNSLYPSPEQQQYYASTQYEYGSDPQQQEYSSGMEASVYAQTYVDPQGYAAQHDAYPNGQAYEQTQTQNVSYDPYGSVYGSYSTNPSQQFDSSVGAYDPPVSNTYLDSMTPSTLHQYPVMGVSNQIEAAPPYTQQRLYTPGASVSTGTVTHNQVTYPAQGHLQSASQYLQQSHQQHHQQQQHLPQQQPQQQQRPEPFESPASRSARLKISEPPQAPPGDAPVAAGRAGQQRQSASRVVVISHLTRQQDRLKEAQVMKPQLVEQLARAAPLWCVVLNYLGPAAAKQTVFTSAQMVQLFTERKVTCATLMLGVASHNRLVATNVNPAFLRPLVFLLSLLKSGGAYLPASEADLTRGAGAARAGAPLLSRSHEPSHGTLSLWHDAVMTHLPAPPDCRGHPPPGWCIPACCFTPKARSASSMYAAANGGSPAPGRGFISQMQARTHSQPSTPAAAAAEEEDEDACADRLLKSVSMWAVLTTYTQMGAWRCPPQHPRWGVTIWPHAWGGRPGGQGAAGGVRAYMLQASGHEAARQFAAGALTASTPVLGTLEPAQRGQWMPTGLVLPLGLILHLAMHEGLEYTPIPAADLSLYTIDVLRTVTGKADRAALWVAAAAAGDKSAIAVVAAQAAASLPEPTAAQRTVKGYLSANWAGENSNAHSIASPSAARAPPPAATPAAGVFVQTGLAASLALLDISGSSTSEDSPDQQAVPSRRATAPGAPRTSNGQSAHVPTLQLKQIVSSRPDAAAEAVTSALIDRDRAASEAGSQSSQPTPAAAAAAAHHEAQAASSAARWHVVATEHATHLGTGQAGSSGGHAFTQAGQGGAVPAASAAARAAGREAPAPGGADAHVSRTASGLCFGSVHVQEGAGSAAGSAHSRPQPLPTSPGASGTPPPHEQHSGGSHPPVPHASRPTIAPLHIFLASTGSSSSGCSNGGGAAPSCGGPASHPLGPGTGTGSGSGCAPVAARAGPVAFAMPVPMAVSKGAGSKSASSKAGRSRTAGAVPFPTPVGMSQQTPQQPTSPQSRQVPPCGISALSPTSLPFRKFETAVFRLFMGDTAQRCFTSLWWYVDAAAGSPKVLGPFSCEQMMLAYIAQLLNNNVPVCGAEASVLPLRQPNLALFRPLGELIKETSTNIPYRLATHEEASVQAAEPAHPAASHAAHISTAGDSKEEAAAMLI
ncbi:MAG: hypothetical protein WDW38_000404 [Sanguina aurantia]